MMGLKSRNITMAFACILSYLCFYYILHDNVIMLIQVVISIPLIMTCLWFRDVLLKK